MAQLIDLSLIPALDDNGRPYSGAQIRCFDVGTLNPVTVYKDPDGVNPHDSMQIRANAAGRLPAIYIDGPIRLQLLHGGVVVRDVARIEPYMSEAALSGSDGGTLVSVRQNDANAATRSVSSKLASFLLLSDFLTTAEIALVESRDPTADLGHRLQQAIDYAASRKKDLCWDITGGRINTSTTIQMRSNVVLWSRDRWNVMRSGGPSYNTELLASESAATIRLADGADTNVVEFAHAVIRAGLHGISVDGNKANNPGGNCVVFMGGAEQNRTSNFLDNCQVHGASGDGIWAQSGQLEVRLHRVYSHDHTGVAIRWASNDAYIDDTLGAYSECGLLIDEGNVRLNRFDAFGCTVGVEMRDVVYGHFHALQSNGNRRNGLIIRGINPALGCQQLRFTAATITDNSTEDNGEHSAVLSTSVSGSNAGIVFVASTFGLISEDSGSQKNAYEVTEAVPAAATFVGCQFNRDAFNAGLASNGYNEHYFIGCQDVDGARMSDSAPVQAMTRSGGIVSACQGTGFDYKSSSFTAVSGIAKYQCNANTGDITVSLPSAASVSAGHDLTLVKQGALNSVTVAPFAGDSIDGGTSITAARGVLRLFSDGISAWISY